MGAPSNPEQAVKLVFAGPVAAGKSTAIRSISDGEPISTDVPVSDGVIEGKETTTVALDYSVVKLGQGTELLVYGLPGQDHFAFMRPIVLNGAFGVIVLLDGRDPALLEHCRSWIQVVTENAPNAAMIVGITHTDLVHSFSLESLREVARGGHAPIPIFTFDARKREEALQVVRALILCAT